MYSKLVSTGVIISLIAQSVAQVPVWGQCGGINWTGETTCTSGNCCNYFNPYYSQCLPGSCSGPTSSTTKTISTITSTIKTSSRTPTSATSISTTKSTTTTRDIIPTGVSTGLVGYAEGATGGGSGSGTTVANCAALTAAIKLGGVIRVNGLLSGCGILRVVSNTSILGVGSNSGIVNGGLLLRDVTNVIIRNLKLSPSAGADAVALDTATKVWVDHCEFYSAGITGSKDFYDGLLDITHASDFVTVSFCVFRDHWKGSLVGHSDSNASEDTGHLRITYHHNYWSNVNSRLPSLRFGTGHVFSSCFENCPTSGINSRMGAVVRAEQNSFNNVPLALVTDLDSDQEGSIQNISNILLGTSTIRITKVGSLTPPYSYTTTPASNVCALVKSQAGIGKITV